MAIECELRLIGKSKKYFLRVGKNKKNNILQIMKPIIKDTKLFNIKFLFNYVLHLIFP